MSSGFTIQENTVAILPHKGVSEIDSFMGALEAICEYVKIVPSIPVW
jgi:hypothetical protein